MAKPILFISDLHLNSSCPETVDLFLRFLQELAARAQALYILGDFFEMWIGDDDHCALNVKIQQALKAVTAQGVAVYLLHGNRDFLISQRFCQAAGCQLLADPTKIDLFGTPTLLMHGDTLCTDDIQYQHFRRLVRHPWFKKAYLALPLRFRRWLANRARQGSYQHTRKTQLAIMDINQTEVENVMRQYQVSLLIHGHTHRPATHHVMIDNNSAKRIVLGAWHSEGNALVCYPNQPPKYYTFTSGPVEI